MSRACIPTPPSDASSRRRAARETLLGLVVPLSQLALLPVILVWLAPIEVSQRWRLGQWLGLWLAVDGVGLLAWSALLYVLRGDGGPWLFGGPRRLVTCGPYRYVRNPMALGTLLIAAGEAAWTGSIAFWAYVSALAAGQWTIVRLIEEPRLAARFGEAYGTYYRSVPGWIPGPGACACSATEGKEA